MAQIQYDLTINYRGQRLSVSGQQRFACHVSMSAFDAENARDAPRAGDRCRGDMIDLDRSWK